MAGSSSRSRQDGRVAIVTLDHPPVNALSARLLEELEEEYDRLDRSDETRAIVLRGEGEKAFVAGADITEFPALRDAAIEAAEQGSARGIQKLAARMDAGRTPVVAAIHGYPRRRAGARDGLRHPDRGRRRAARPAGDQARPDPRRRRHAAAAAARRPGRALYLNLSGDPISGAQAYDWGLVEQAVPLAELMETALGLARTLSGARRTRWA